MDQKPPTRTRYAGPTTCLRCDETFDSWDRRQNRLCPCCLQAIEEGASDGASYPLPTPIRRSHIHEDG
jgi:hypothetical protein